MTTTTTSNVSVEPLDFDRIYFSYKLYSRMPRGIKCHPTVYRSLMKYFDAIEVDMLLNGIKLPEINAINAIFGLRIDIDSVNLKEGEYEFTFQD